LRRKWPKPPQPSGRGGSPEAAEVALDLPGDALRHPDVASVVVSPYCHSARLA
jgi:hypothetical protein